MSMNRALTPIITVRYRIVIVIVIKYYIAPLKSEALPEGMERASIVAELFYRIHSEAFHFSLKTVLNRFRVWRT